MADLTNKAVFLSYASQDAEAARRICEALRAAGVEVWFDQNELVGGDEWDAKIRGQIGSCALFVPVISANTQARREGYFRLEWKLADERTHLMAEGTPFLLPFVIDRTSDATALVPKSFRAVQWMRLPGGDVPESALHQVQRLLGFFPLDLKPAQDSLPSAVAGTHEPAANDRRGLRRSAMAAVIVGVGAVAWHFNTSTPTPFPENSLPTRTVVLEEKAPAPIIPPANDAEKSVVVLPLENLSSDRDDQYFADAMHSEIIATLTRSTELKVISRTSAIALRGDAGSLAAQAAKVGVANVVAGSVRRTSSTVRVILELRRAHDEALLWTQTYERQPSDLAEIHNQIAQDLARVLQAQERKGFLRSARYWTKNPEALTLFAESSRRFRSRFTTGYESSLDAAIASAEQAMALDSEYLTAASYLITLHTTAFLQKTDPKAVSYHATQAKHWVDTASRLMPGGAADAELGYYLLRVERDPARAMAVLEKAVRAFPNDSSANNRLALALIEMGRAAEAVAAFQRALSLDPLNATMVQNHIQNMARLRRLADTAAAVEHYRSIRNTNYSRNIVALHHFLARGEVPADLSGMSTTAHVGWLWQAGRFAEILEYSAHRIGRADTNDVDRFHLRWREYQAARALDSAEVAEAAALDLQAIEQRLRSVPEVDRSDKQFRLAVAALCTGRGDQGINIAKRWTESVLSATHPHERWQREAQLAAFHAQAGNNEACVALLAKLLRVPSGITVPMLRTSPDWKNVRDDAVFKGLLADPKNNAPL